jgi:hypothetical protein
MHKNSFALAFGLAALTTLAGCSGAPDLDESTSATHEAIAAKPLACSDLAGTWKATLNNANVSIGGLPSPLTGTIDFTLTQAGSSSLAFSGTLNGAAGPLPVSAPLSNITIGCDGNVAIDSQQMFAIGQVKFQVNGSISASSQTQGTFNVQSVSPPPALQITASGGVTFAKQ